VTLEFAESPDADADVSELFFSAVTEMGRDYDAASSKS